MAKRIHLLQRDLEILETIAERRVETLTALHELHWENAQRKTAYNRLGMLARAGYLEHRVHGDAEPGTGRKQQTQHVYLLGPKAPTALRIRDRQLHRLAGRRVHAGTPDGLVEHQLAVNRVGDWLGTRLLSEYAASPPGTDHRLRPDGAYHGAPDGDGRSLVLIEVDLGHYTRDRILAKIEGFLAHPGARSVVFATPTEERATLLARWARETYSLDDMHRLQFFSFGELRAGAPLDPGTHPTTQYGEVATADWYRAVMGPPGID